MKALPSDRDSHAENCPMRSDDNMPCVCGVVPTIIRASAAGDARVTVPREEIIAAWLRELSSEANYADKGDGWKLTLKGKIEREKAKQRLSILRSMLSAAPQHSTDDEAVSSAMLLHVVSGTWVKSWDQHIGADGAAAIFEALSNYGLRITRKPGGQT